jgi:hypothetical protein
MKEAVLKGFTPASILGNEPPIAWRIAPTPSSAHHHNNDRVSWRRLRHGEPADEGWPRWYSKFTNPTLYRSHF